MTTPLKPESITALLAELARLRFWGSVQLDIQDGQFILIRKTETIKSLESNTRGNTRHEYNR